MTRLLLKTLRDKHSFLQIRFINSSVIYNQNELLSIRCGTTTCIRLPPRNFTTSGRCTHTLIVIVNCLRLPLESLPPPPLPLLPHELFLYTNLYCVSFVQNIFFASFLIRFLFRLAKFWHMQGHWSRTCPYAHTSSQFYFNRPKARVSSPVGYFDRNYLPVSQRALLPPINTHPPLKVQQVSQGQQHSVPVLNSPQGISIKLAEDTRHV